MIALVDCNNFYASCERAFNPKLIGLPVVVLSNNDGCVIARSQEAKDLGIKMGDVPHLTPLVERCVQQSSNYTLYGDMSNRVCHTLSKFTWALEPYSIDESFLVLKDADTFELIHTGNEIKSAVWKTTGLPVCVGIAKTKALAKLANRIAKKDTLIGVHAIRSEDQMYEALMKTAIEDVWGIGRQHAARLRAIKVNTAYDFTQLTEEWIQEHMSVVGCRLRKELLGTPCAELELEPPRKKGICTGRSFGELLEKYEEISEAVAVFSARCGEKLREDESNAEILQVFVHTNPHRQDLKQYANQRTIKLPYPTNDTITLVSYAHKALQAIFRPGYRYMKAGVFVSGITDADKRQLLMFDETDHEKQEKTMGVMDLLNKQYGRGTLRLGCMAGEKKYRMRAERLSGCYTTKWKDIITVKTS